MATQRRISLSVIATACFAVLLSAAPAHAQDDEQPPPEPVLPGGGAAAHRDEIDRLPRIITNIPGYIERREWHTLAHALAMVQRAGGLLLPERLADAAGKPYVHWRSPVVQANQILAKLPPEALKVYDAHYGGPGRKLIERAQKEKNPRLLALAVERYLYTAAGPEALALLAEHYTDAGRDLAAALCYRLLLTLPHAQPSSMTEMRAIIAFRKTGDVKKAAQMWQRLLAQLPKDLPAKIREQVERTRKFLEKIKPAPHSSDWLVFQGNAARSGTAKGGRPDLTAPRWQRPTILDKNSFGETEPGKEAKVWIDKALTKAREKPDMPILPGFCPIAVGDLVIYRNYQDVTAVNLKEVREQGKVVATPGEVEWKSTPLESSLVDTLRQPSQRVTLETWLGQTYERAGLSSVVYDNAAVGTLSTDGRLVYVIDDLAVPVPPAALAPRLWESQQIEVVNDQVRANNLQGFEAATGKIAFRLGEPRRDSEFTGSHFLGAPLPLDGGLYVLNEVGDGEVRLAHLKPTLLEDPRRRTYRVIISLQPLAKVQERFISSPLRRTQPVHLASGDGVLVCPTHAGAVLGVDLITQSLQWGYTYRTGKPAPPDDRKAPKPPPLDLRPEWWYCAPVIVGGKVIFTSPDEPSVHCLDLRDGKLLWKAARTDDDLYLAGVYSGKVLLVGKTGCRALDLANGKEVWRRETGVPSGMGVADRNTYYLPLRSRAKSGRAGICALDIAEGTLLRDFPAGKEAPGNLLFHRGQLISQGPTSITAYPLAKREGSEP